MSSTVPVLPDPEVLPRANTEPPINNGVAYKTLFHGRCPKCEAEFNNIAQQLHILRPAKIRCFKCKYTLLALDAVPQDESPDHFTHFRPAEDMQDFSLTFQRVSTSNSVATGTTGQMGGPPTSEPQVNGSIDEVPLTPTAQPLRPTVSAPEARQTLDIHSTAEHTKKKRHRTGSMIIKGINRIMLAARGWKLTLHRVSASTTQIPPHEIAQPDDEPPANQPSQDTAPQHAINEQAIASNRLIPSQQPQIDDSCSGTQVPDSEPDQRAESIHHGVRFVQGSTPPRSQTPAVSYAQRTDTDLTDASSRSGEGNSQFDGASTHATRMSGTSGQVPSLEPDDSEDESDEATDDEDPRGLSRPRPRIMTPEARLQHEANFRIMGAWANQPADPLPTAMGQPRIRSPSPASSSRQADLLSSEHQDN